MFSDIRHIFNLTFRLYGTCFVSSSCFVAMFSNKLHNNETKSLEKGIIFLAHQWKMKHNDLALSSQEHCNDHCLTQADTSTRDKFDFTARSFPQLRLHLTCSFHTPAFTHLKLISTHQGLRVDSHSHACQVVFSASALDLPLAAVSYSVTISLKSLLLIQTVTFLDSFNVPVLLCAYVRQLAPAHVRFTHTIHLRPYLHLRVVFRYPNNVITIIVVFTT